ncbi:MAG: hypothetical protein J2P27_08130 [Actinobacteria bacterium]|nr:hypothetical protein [Actinomycetota bacterium]
MTAENAGADRPAPLSSDTAAAGRAAARDRNPVPLIAADPLAQFPAGARPARNAIVGAGVIGYAWLLGGTTPFSTRALLGVLLPGAVLSVIAFTRPPERITPPESVDVAGFSYWVICIALLFEWEAAAVRDDASWHPSLTDLVNPLIAPHPIKTAAIVVWLLAGWALVRR